MKIWLLTELDSDRDVVRRIRGVYSCYDGALHELEEITGCNDVLMDAFEIEEWGVDE